MDILKSADKDFFIALSVYCSCVPCHFDVSVLHNALL